MKVNSNQIKSIYKKGKKAYVKARPIRRGIIKHSRRIGGNIDNYFANSQKEMRDIAKNYGSI